MNDLLTSQERYKRAYELYLKRNNITIEAIKEKNVKGKSNRKLKNQILVSIFISLLLLFIKKINISYADEIFEKIDLALTYNTNFKATYDNTYQYLKENVYSKIIVSKDNNYLENKSEKDDEVNVNNSELENSINEEIVEDEKENTEIISENVEVINDNKNLSQMEIDANDIKTKYSFIKPVDGSISSKFGNRNPTSENVPKYHTGIDLAVNTGTEVKAAIDGKVVFVSSEGDYGKHIKVQTGDDIITLYAHCSEIKVNEGDEITNGQIIALSGNTGNTTGPHLHFEIRKENRYVDPELIVEF